MSISLFDVRIDDYPEPEVLNIIKNWLRGNRARIIVTPNPEFILQARKDKGFCDLLKKSDLSVADGVALRYATAALYGTRLNHRIAGVDLVQKIAALCSSSNDRLLLIGGAPNAAKLSAHYFQTKYPDLIVSYLDPGHIDYTHENLNISEVFWEKIEDHAPQVVAIALGQGKQEAFMVEAQRRLKSVRVLIGIGGALDMISGLKQRGPEWMRNLGLEWLWRLWIEPRRYKRILNATIIFPCIIAIETIKRRRFFRACKSVFPEVFKQLSGL